MTGAGRLGVLAAGAVISWAVTPWVSMAAHGTVDSRHRDGVRRLGAAVANPMPAAWDTVPGQSRAGSGSGARPAPVASSMRPAPPRRAR